MFCAFVEVQGLQRAHPKSATRVRELAARRHGQDARKQGRAARREVALVEVQGLQPAEAHLVWRYLFP